MRNTTTTIQALVWALDWGLAVRYVLKKPCMHDQLVSKKATTNLSKPYSSWALKGSLGHDIRNSNQWAWLAGFVCCGIKHTMLQASHEGFRTVEARTIRLFLITIHSSVHATECMKWKPKILLTQFETAHEINPQQSSDGHQISVLHLDSFFLQPEWYDG